MKWKLIPVFVMLIGVVSCSKDDNDPAPQPTAENKVSFTLQYNVDGASIIRDSIMYYNDAGNHYSIYNILYYLSQITLVKSDGSTVLLKDYHYVDCFDPATNEFSFDNVPQGDYTGISFNIGIDSAHNDHDVIPVTFESINMEWPDQMGGGFHFLRLEGYFEDAGNNYGYAMHLGTNNCLMPVALSKNFTMTADSKMQLTLKMNVNEWFRNPNTYNLNLDSNNYIMGDLPRMMLITENGLDVFSF